MYFFIPHRYTPFFGNALTIRPGYTLTAQIQASGNSDAADLSLLLPIQHGGW